jgi:uncharacterized protein YPO0396
MASDPNAKTRVRIAFLLLVVFIAVFAVGAWFVADLDRLQEMIAARESRTALQGIGEPAQINEALRQHPQNKFLRLMAMATKTADETNAAIEKLSNDVEPPAISKNANLGAASRNDLDALRRDLKTAEANATALVPRTAALLKTERDNVEKYARSLYLGKDAVGDFLGHIDKRHAEIAAFTSGLSAARADYYRAYEKYVAVLVTEFGAYKVVNGEFIFPFQRTVDRYNAAAEAMTAAAKRVGEQEGKRNSLREAQQAGWMQFVSGM